MGAMSKPSAARRSNTTSSTVMPCYDKSFTPGMTTAVPDILARIVEHKRASIPSIRSRLSELELRASVRMDRRDFSAAISAAPAIIAEAKKASPSKGLLAGHFDPESIARAYEHGGAA